MNPLIQELATLAGLTTNLDTDFFDKDINRWLDYYSEKFAELIVKECLDKIEAEAAQYHEPVWAVELIGDIQEHFGVEE